MISVRDFEESSNSSSKEMGREKRMVTITIGSCDQRGYTIVNVECKDHSRLMFDIVCTLTDMEFKKGGTLLLSFTQALLVS